VELIAPTRPFKLKHVRCLSVLELAQRFREHIGAIGVGGAVLETEFISGDHLSDEVVSDVNMLGPSMNDGVRSDLDRGLIVDVQSRGVVLNEAHLAQEPSEPYDFLSRG
jgi:hypothetical protein